MHQRVKWWNSYQRGAAIRRLMSESGKYTKHDLMEYYLHRTYKGEDCELFESLLTLAGIDRVIDLQRDMLKAAYRSLPNDRIMFNFQERFVSTPDYLTVKQSKSLLKHFCKHNSIDYANLVRDLRTVLLNQGGKRNCFYMEGDPNSGKTLLFQAPLKELYDFWAQPMQINTSSTFVFCDVPMSRIIFIDEAACDPIHLETLKLLMAGEPCLVNVKHLNATYVHRTPVIITTNNPPWFYKISEQAAFEARMFAYRCKHWPYLSNKTILNKRFNPLLYCQLLRD